MGESNSDFPAQPYLAAMPSSYPIQMWSHPLFQNLAQTAMPAFPVHGEEQDIGGQQGGTQTSPSDKTDSPELPGPRADAGHRSSQSTSSDANHEYSQMGGAKMPYDYPGGFVFPAPYPGQLDPLMLWMHHMQRQMAYLYSAPGCRNGHQHPTPTSSNGVSQRGFIKIPSGIPQKQSHLWERQSTENMQLWTTVTRLTASLARAEAEIFCQRRKLSKLEDDLQLMNARQDAMSEALQRQSVSPQRKRVRRKRTATAPVAILGLPASHLLAEKAQVKKARGLISEGDILKVSYPPSGRSEGTDLDSNLECTNIIMHGASANGPSLIVGLDRKEIPNDAPSNDEVGRDHGGNGNACTGDIGATRGSEDGCVRGIIPAEMTKETSSSQNAEMKQECGHESTRDMVRCNEGAASGQRKVEGYLTESEALQALGCNDCNTDSEMMMGELCIVEDRFS
ncbi:hypothetical protein GOP47_0010541 [Adiantum capillus-veneris]|uniref:Uncharacterized protein n=1 Tax=Adiantum capillus-veneris TaxID=13818 RepID=A0A9D4UUU7_ADICA|nr:hypothetical protein GOP47_0010541 [Adiantum capillus-veneris]